ncbi:MAG: hypothetical protein EOP85_16805, partial [Verrucomicrobiaceae bacterium]
MLGSSGSESAGASISSSFIGSATCDGTVCLISSFAFEDFACRFSPTWIPNHAAMRISAGVMTLVKRKHYPRVRERFLLREELYDSKGEFDEFKLLAYTNEE